MLSEKPDGHISSIIKSIDKAGMRGRINIAFDEWNLRSWHHPGFSGHNPRKVDYQDPKIMALIKARDKSLQPSLYTMADALFCASFFNACLRNADHVTMANISCLVNQTGPLYVHPEGIVKRTHFHTMAMYANLLQRRVVQTKVKATKLTHGSASVAMIDAIATVDKSGTKWAVAIINRNPSQKVVCTLKIGKLPIDGPFKATILTGDSPDSYNDIEHPHRVAPKEIKLDIKKNVMSLPPHSLVIVEGQLIR
tara:strand:- start:88 stop:843 length:756 start_codon:yes stop_codon:yes gene_type:complete